MLNANKETKPLINFASNVFNMICPCKIRWYKNSKLFEAVDIIYIVVEDFAFQFPITIYKHTFGFLEIQS